MRTGCGTLFPSRSIPSRRRWVSDDWAGAPGCTIVSVIGSLSGRPSVAERELGEEPRPERRRAGGAPRVVHVRHHRPADVEVAEGDAFGEVLEEESGGDRPRVLTAHVLDVGDGGVD